MILTKITGGLGNQMSQYAIAKSIAKKNNDDFKLDISFYPEQTLQKYELDLFNIEENIASEDELIKYAANENFWFKVKRKLKLKDKRPNSYFIEKETAILDSNVFDYNNDIYLDGYWQCEEYFKDIKFELLDDFTLKDDISSEARKYLKDIKNSNSVSLHVRRGDYVQNSRTSSVHGTSDLEYYQKAIKYIKTKVDKSIFYIFSDDIEWCKENFIFLENKIFIDDTKNPFDDLVLMKCCKYNIIANSTFSWWSAWLNENENKIVIAPKVWWKILPSKNISCDNWIKI